MKTAAAAPALALALAACASPDVIGAGSELAAEIEAGAQRVPADARDDLLVGNTLVAQGVRVYYAPDGGKTVQTADGQTIERRWRLREDGIMCEQLTVSGAEVCADAASLYVSHGLYRAFRPDGTASALTFRIEAGNALQPTRADDGPWTEPAT